MGNDCCGSANSKKKGLYFCPKGHQLEWLGAKFLYKSSMICDRCGKNSNLYHPIRWRCPKCNYYFCSLCYDIIISEKCPVNHTYKLIREEPISYVCDKCYGSFPKYSDRFNDVFCNITYCQKCFYEHVNYSKQNDA